MAAHRGAASLDVVVAAMSPGSPHGCPIDGNLRHGGAAVACGCVGQHRCLRQQVGVGCWGVRTAPWGRHPVTGLVTPPCRRHRGVWVLPPCCQQWGACIASGPGWSPVPGVHVGGCRGSCTAAAAQCCEYRPLLPQWGQLGIAVSPLLPCTVPCWWSVPAMVENALRDADTGTHEGVMVWCGAPTLMVLLRFVEHPWARACRCGCPALGVPKGAESPISTRVVSAGFGTVDAGVSVQ